MKLSLALIAMFCSVLLLASAQAENQKVIPDGQLTDKDYDCMNMCDDYNLLMDNKNDKENAGADASSEIEEMKTLEQKIKDECGETYHCAFT